MLTRKAHAARLWLSLAVFTIVGALHLNRIVQVGAQSQARHIHITQYKGYPCEEPYSDNVRFHVVIPTYSRKSYSLLHYLGMVGLTNADIFIYLRKDPGDKHQVQVDLPCGMRLHERLLLPNQGDESAAITTHVALHYDNLPDAVMLLHGGSLHSWHSMCSVALRRMRAFYRGLGSGPAATPAMKAFTQRAQTLNSCKHKGELQECCGALFCRAPGTVDGTTCPWEKVGTAWGIDLDGQKVTQPLCQLVDRTPETNWTVLGIDIPEFFMDKERVLRQYETDPFHRVPITHSPRVSDSSPVSDSRKLLHESVSAGESQLGDSRGGCRRLLEREDKQWQPSPHPHEAKDGGENAAQPKRQAALEPLVNARDELFPDNREKDLIPLQRGRQVDVGNNGRVYGLIRFWEVILKAHGMRDIYKGADHEKGEWDHSWCCLQFIAPRHVLQRASKGWWEDVAFFLTHIAWQERAKWPMMMGTMVEWHLWPALGQRFNTLETNKVYLDIDREMGEDKELLRCSKHVKMVWEPKTLR